MTTILIAGASRGIGLALAAGALGRGHRVIAAVRTPDHASRLAALPGVRIEALDVTDPASCEALAARLDGEIIDALICNAGVLEGRGGLADPDYTADSWSRSLMTNVAGPFFTVRALTARMAAPGGRIGIVSSAMGAPWRAKGDSYSYRATKAAATNVAQNLAAELKPKGIAVAAFHPGWVRTDMGGAGADIGVEDSAAGLLDRMETLSIAQTGAFLNWDGTPVAP